MKNSLLILLLFVVSCAQSPQEKLAHINGYWEIASVENSVGDTKNFGMSQNIDFINIEDNKGVRKKVQPDVAGNFTTSEATENIDVEIDHSKLTLLYSTPFDSWQETVIKATATELIVENQNGNRYTYRRYTPLVQK